MKSIDICAFEECKSLKSIVFPNGITGIGDTAFGGCTGLIDAAIPGSVTSIGKGAFGGCTSLKSVTIPKRLEAAIKWCKSIEKINYINDADSIAVLSKNTSSPNDSVIENGVLEKYTGTGGYQ